MVAFLLNPPRKGKRGRSQRKRYSRRKRGSGFRCGYGLKDMFDRKAKSLAKRLGGLRQTFQKKQAQCLRSAERSAHREESRREKKRYKAALGPGSLRGSSSRRRSKMLARRWAKFSSVAKNPRGHGRFRFKYRPRRRNYSSWIPAYKTELASNPYWIPRYAMNPGADGILRAPLAGYRVPALTQAAFAAVGFMGNIALRGTVRNLVPINALKSGIGEKLLGIGTAGLLAAGAGMVNKRWAGPIFAGAMLQAIVDVVRPLIPRRFGGTGSLLDYLSVGDAAGARPLGFIGAEGLGAEGLGARTIADEIQTGDYALEDIGGGDWITPNSIAARGGDNLTLATAYPTVPLMGFGNDAIEDTAEVELETA
jgi:hypothetical protein